jgi:hypothetical protein
MKQFTIIAKRNYYGEIQEQEFTIEGETYERAKFYFNINHIDWSVKHQTI